MPIEPADDDPVRKYNSEEERRLTLNLAKLLRTIRDVDKNKEYSLELIRSWHFQLFDGVREHAGKNRTADYGEVVLDFFGQLKSIPRAEVEQAFKEHVDVARELFSQLKDLGDSRNRLIYPKEVIRAALYLHATFIKMQAFRDGNKRMGGLIMTYVLIRHGIPAISFDVPRLEYFDCLKTFYDSGNKNIGPLYDLAIRLYNRQFAR